MWVYHAILIVVACYIGGFLGAMFALVEWLLKQGKDDGEEG